MKIDLFSIPVFIDKVDLSKIEMSDTGYDETFLSNVNSNYLFKPQLEPHSHDYLVEILEKNLKETGKYIDPRITSIWRNIYEPQNTQEVHIHANSQWSFIIYETVEYSRTVFLSPAWKQIETTMGYEALPTFSSTWRPKLEAGSILIFPSFLEHYVLAGNIGTTIAGNVNLKYVQEKNV
jgi:hypothetical protein